MPKRSDKMSAAMRRELADMDAISAHCNVYGTPHGVKLTLRSVETGRLIRCFCALYPEGDRRPRPVAIERHTGLFGASGLAWVPWLDARWDGRSLTSLRDRHGPDPRLDDDDQEDLCAVTERLRRGGVGDDPEEDPQ